MEWVVLIVAGAAGFGALALGASTVVALVAMLVVGSVAAVVGAHW